MVKSDLKHRQNAQLQRVVAIINAVSSTKDGLTRTQLAESLALSRATTHRLVSALVGFGLFRLDERGKVLLGATLARWGMASLEQTSLRTACVPELERLANEMGETANLGVINGQEFVYLERAESPHSVRMTGRLGMAMPLYCTAIGRCLLAGMKSDDEILHHISERLLKRTVNTITEPLAILEIVHQVREEGFAVDVCENEEHVVCIAAPVCDNLGKTIAAISLSGPDWRMMNYHSFIAPVVAAASRISHNLGWSCEDVRNLVEL